MTDSMTHYAEAERLLAEAAPPSYVVTVPDNTSMESLDKIKAVLAERGMAGALVGSESVRIDATPVLLAALTHAVLAMADADANVKLSLNPQSIRRVGEVLRAGHLDLIAEQVEAQMPANNQPTTERQ